MTVAAVLLLICCCGVAAVDGAPGASRNIFGDPSSECYVGAPGYRDSCPTSAENASESSLCVEPTAISTTPFCLNLRKFARYLVLEMGNGFAAPPLRVKCIAIPQELMDSDSAAAHILLDDGYLMVVQHICRHCSLSGVLTPGPAQWCWAIEQGTTTTTLPYAPLPWMLPALPRGPSSFWPVVAMLGAGWGGALLWLGVCRCDAAQGYDSDSDSGLSQQRSARGAQEAPSALYAGVWEMLGQRQVVSDTELRWQDRKVSRIKAISATRFSVTQGGGTEEAWLDDTGQRLLWSNGSVWVRPEEGEPLLAAGTGRA